MTWIVSESSTTLGTLPADRLADHLRVIQREAGVLIIATHVILGPLASSESMLARRLLDRCERSVDELEPGQRLMPTLEAGVRGLVESFGDEGAAFVSAIWLAGDRLELWACGRDDLLVFVGPHALVQRCSPRLVLPGGRGALYGGIGGHGVTSCFAEPTELLACGGDRLRVVVLHQMSSEVSLVPALLAWQRARAAETSATQLAELAHQWVFDRSQRCGFVTVVDLIAG